MLERLKKSYSRLASNKPGERFRGLHERQQRTKISSWKNALYIIGGVVLIGMGILLSIPPLLPGFLVTLAGLGIIATRSHAFARFLDRLELAVRRILKRIRNLV
jgi:hypothetical protein